MVHTSYPRFKNSRPDDDDDELSSALALAGVSYTLLSFHLSFAFCLSAFLRSHATRLRMACDDIMYDARAPVGCIKSILYVGIARQQALSWHGLVIRRRRRTTMTTTTESTAPYAYTADDTESE